MGGVAWGVVGASGEDVERFDDEDDEAFICLIFIFEDYEIKERQTNNTFVNNYLITWSKQLNLVWDFEPVYEN